jgi:Galactose oxidase, central domain
MGAMLLLAGCNTVLDVTPDLSGPCTTDRDCPSSQLCMDSRCQDRCSSNSDCAVGQTCQLQPSGNVCAPVAEASAGDDAASDVGQVDATDRDATLPSPDADGSPVDADATVDAQDAISDARNATTEADTQQDAPQDGDDSTTSDGPIGDEASDGGAPEDSSSCTYASNTCDDGGDASTCMRAVMFGGQGLNSPLDETWVFTNGAWSQIYPTPSPSPRYWSPMATGCDGVFLFGGEGSDPLFPLLDDAWQWQPSGWSPILPPVADAGADAGSWPSARAGAAMARVAGKLVLFGGYIQGPAPVASDTWLWDGSLWTQVRPSTSPQARAGAAYGTVNGKFVLFGGFDDQNDVLGDTWSWDGSSWTEIAEANDDDAGVPYPQARAFAAFGVAGGKLVLFGGTADGNYMNILGDTWTWDGTSWTEEKPVHSPSPRHQSAVAGGDSLLLFGGADTNYNPLPDTWTWNGSDWTQLPISGPDARYAATISSY